MEPINFADCYVLTHHRTQAFILSFLNHFLPNRIPYASAYEVPQHADPPDIVFQSDTALITYLEAHPQERHAIYWENKDASAIKAGMCLFTSDGQVIMGLTCETHDPDITLETHCLEVLKEFCESRTGLIEYDTPAAQDTAAFLERIRNATAKNN